MPSSVVSTMSYDIATATLTITFVTGMVYNYKKVPEEVYNALKASGAKGIFLNQHIKGKYPFEKIK